MRNNVQFYDRLERVVEHLSNQLNGPAAAAGLVPADHQLHMPQVSTSLSSAAPTVLRSYGPTVLRSRAALGSEPTVMETKGMTVGLAS
jgi:hypothetical protein